MGQLAKTVLIVDDALDAAHSLALVVQTLGIRAEYTTSPLTALSVARQLKPDFALLDLGMPGFSGFALAHMLRAEFPSMTLIAVTGHGGEEMKRRSTEAGFDHHVLKPADPSFIAQLLATEPTGTRSRSGPAV